ncbi:hypothetical protein GOP47_0003727 [Adiantum capillus-veneris]|uniref:RRM domain-containing protein n=1 Tax=Adiantum capillus-veneris TaxID=13818 RepID=A0A9D4ZM58_ADICA|nr:hypothetical protein GOP47_0003727 [Adiantum capillus-veneris]
MSMRCLSCQCQLYSSTALRRHCGSGWMIAMQASGGKQMARGNNSTDFSVLAPKAAEADWAYSGECWMSGSSIGMVDDSNISSSGSKKNQSLLSASWAILQRQPGIIPALYDPLSSAQSDSLGEMDWTVQDKLSALLHNKLSLSDSVNAEAGSSVQSCKNHQCDFSELEWQTIGSLLPDDDDLFLSVASDMDGNITTSYSGENEELDLFSSGGGLELEGDPLDPRWSKKNAEATAGVGEHPYGEHPSRTLFVRNINSSVEDAELRVLFEQFGDIRTLYTACKHRGFVMISYYDIRAARSAMRALQNKALRRRKLDIHFSIPKDNPSDKDVNQGTLVVFNLDASVSNDELRQIFGVYGEVKEIRETPHKRHHKFIEFYDVRSAEAALRALNRCDIAGKRIKLEPSRPGGARRSLMQSLPFEMEQEESPFFKEPNSPPLPKSAPVKFATTDCRIFEKDPVLEACQSLKYMGLGLHSPFVCTNSVSEFASGTEPAHFSASAAISAMKARMLSDHLMKIGGTGFNMVSSLESANGGSALIDSLHSHSMETLPADGFLASSLNSLYLKENHSTLLPHSPARSAFGVNGFASHCEARPYPHFLGGALLSPNHYHVGSAPITALPMLDRNQAYSREPFDVLSATGSSGAGSGFGARHSLELSMSSSLGSLPPGALLSSGLTDHGACPSSWSILQQQKGNSVTKTLRDPLTKHFDWGLERGRSRKAENGVPNYDKKQYELDIQRILRGEDARTTLMIKNIPNKYTSKMLLAAIDEHHKGTYDFIYLPIDFKNKCNVGYAFINMTEPSRIIAFYQAFNGKRWEKFNSEKVASLAYARIQGKAALIAHFQNSSLMNEDKRCRPILFHTGGPNVGGQEPFPIGTNPRARLNKGRGSLQGSPIGRY